MHDLKNKIKITTVLQPIVVSATATHTDISLIPGNSAVLVIATGVDAGSGLSGSHKLVFTLKDSADGTTYADVEDADMIGVTGITSGTILTIDSTSEDDTTYVYGYIGGKPYLELTYTETGTVAIPMGIQIIHGDLLDAPAI